MKRAHKFLVSQDASPKGCNTPGQIFRITKVIDAFKTHGLSQCKTCSSPRQADLVFTVEQLARMTPRQQYACFQSQAYEIKQLRRKLRKSSKGRGKVLEEKVLEAKEVLKDAVFELPDQSFIIDNLVKALRTGALMPDTLQYDRLCAIVRNSMNLKVESKTGKYINLSGKNLAITEKEQRHYVQLPLNNSMLGTLVGELLMDLKEGKEEEQRREIDNYLIVHGDLIKRMTFNEFAAALKKGR